MTRTIQVQATKAGSRLDHFLDTQCNDLTRSQIQRLIELGQVLVDGRRCRSADRVRAGQSIAVTIPPPLAVGIVPTNIALTIVVDRPDLLVIDKPAGLVVHPAPGHPDDTLANALMARYPNLTVGYAQRPGIVHRLDKGTSGLMVVALVDSTFQNLVEQMSRRAIHKEYLALVHGNVAADTGQIDAAIGRDHLNRQKMGVVREGRAALTGFRVIERFPGYSFLRIKLETGRTHQIRVHLAAIGHPVVGDAVYGPRLPGLGLNRPFLHSWYLGFELPEGGACLVAWAQLPQELAEVMLRLRTSPAESITSRSNRE